MAIRKPSQASRRLSTRRTVPKAPSRRFSALIGVSLIVLALLWFAWLYLHQINPGLSFLTFSTQAQPSATSDPLAAAGITLTTPAQGSQPRLTRQQALLLTNQIEPTIAARAGAVDAQYTLFSYTRANTPSFHDTPVWLVHYSQVTEPHPDTTVDSHALRTHHDFYVFLDANSGRELLSIWL